MPSNASLRVAMRAFARVGDFEVGDERRCGRSARLWGYSFAER